MGKAPARRPIDEIAGRLTLTREALGLIQAEIGRRAGISAQAWNNYERGRQRISVDEAVKLCISTGVTLDWIYRGDLRGVALDLATKIQELSEKPTTRRRA